MCIVSVSLCVRVLAWQVTCCEIHRIISVVASMLIESARHERGVQVSVRRKEVVDLSVNQDECVLEWLVG